MTIPTSVAEYFIPKVGFTLKHPSDSRGLQYHIALAVRRDREPNNEGIAAIVPKGQ